MATFHIHTELYRFLERTRSNIVSQVLTHQGAYTTEEGDWVRREPNEMDIVSYIPTAKLKYLDPNTDPFANEKLRIKLKVGKFASKFLYGPACREAGIKDKNVEEFVNLFKSYFNCDESKLKVIEGPDILKYYDMNSYALANGNTSGTLWASCMRYPEKNKFMEIYTKNANCKMLVYLEDNGKLRSRALLWEDAKDKYGNAYKVMDRIYSLYDHDVNFFKDWASKNGYLAKSEQSSKSEQFFVRDGKNVRLHLCVKLENHLLKFYPYFDTFKFYDPETGTFGNSEHFKYQHYLVQNWGGLEPEQREPAPGGYDDYLDDNADDGRPDARPRSTRRGYGYGAPSYGSFLQSATIPTPRPTTNVTVTDTSTEPVVPENAVTAENVQISTDYWTSYGFGTNNSAGDPAVPSVKTPTKGFGTVAGRDLPGKMEKMLVEKMRSKYAKDISIKKSDNGKYEIKITKEKEISERTDDYPTGVEYLFGEYGKRGKSKKEDSEKSKDVENLEDSVVASKIIKKVILDEITNAKSKKTKDIFDGFDDWFGDTDYESKGF